MNCAPMSSFDRHTTRQRVPFLSSRRSATETSSGTSCGLLTDNRAPPSDKSHNTQTIGTGFSLTRSHAVETTVRRECLRRSVVVLNQSKMRTRQLHLVKLRL